jgi:hypothetical protein
MSPFSGIAKLTTGQDNVAMSFSYLGRMWLQRPLYARPRLFRSDEEAQRMRTYWRRHDSATSALVSTNRQHDQHTHERWRKDATLAPADSTATDAAAAPSTFTVGIQFEDIESTLAVNLNQANLREDVRRARQRLCRGGTTLPPRGGRASTSDTQAHLQP